MNHDNFPARLLAAIRFLTILPIPGKLGHSKEALAGSLIFFPLVGLGLGMVAGGTAFFLWSFLPPLLAAVLLTMLLAGFSGGLHLDGLADTGDGFCSSRPREQILAIMRDSRIGAMGVFWLVMILVVKIGGLAEMQRSEAMVTALLMPLTGRCAIIMMMALLPYARKEGGLGQLFYTRNSRFTAVGTFFFLILICLSVTGMTGVLIVFFVLLMLMIFSAVCKRVIGGATGDTLGAGCELSEAMVAVAMAGIIWSRQ